MPPDASVSRKWRSTRGIRRPGRAAAVNSARRSLSPVLLGATVAPLVARCDVPTRLPGSPTTEVAAPSWPNTDGALGNDPRGHGRTPAHRSRRPYGYFLLANLAALGVALGPAVTAGLAG